MGNETINIDALATKISKKLSDYCEVTYDVMKDAVKKTAKQTAKEINERAGELFEGGAYKQSWHVKEGRFVNEQYGYTSIVYSWEYRIAHLLENDHAKVSGGRVIGVVKGRAHIAPAEANAQKMLVDEIKAGIARR